MPVGASPQTFRVAVCLHVACAVLLMILVLVLCMNVWRLPASTNSRPTRLAASLAGLTALEIALGLGTWVVRFGWPAWLGEYGIAAAYTVRAASLVQVHMVTAHVAVGSLVFVTSTALTLTAFRQRLCRPRSSAQELAGRRISARLELAT